MTEEDYERNAGERRASGLRGYLNQPLRLAFWLALGYFSFASIYIVLSSEWAARVAETQEELHRIEQAKGVLFIVITTLLLFLFACLMFRRVARDERSLSDYRETLLTANRRAVAGLFASSVAHDINNILMVIESVTEQLGDVEPEEKRNMLNQLRAANEELKSLVKRLASARSERLSESECEFDLSAEIRKITGLVRSHRKARWCNFQIDGPTHLRIVGRPALYHQILLNLLINAAEATGGRGNVRVLARSDDDEIVIEVHDDGPGIPLERRAEIMEPFATTKPDGCGLGLISVRVCAEAHGGKVSVGDSDLGGACFVVTVPKKSLPAAGLAATPPDSHPEGDLHRE
jgi:signal transduction histidine kinase